MSTAATGGMRVALHPMRETAGRRHDRCLAAEPVMPPRPTSTPDLAGDEGPPVTRRAPFSSNPEVGARGLRTQQRILDAALGVFGEVGYDRCSIDRIAKAAGTSRVSFYQYFSDKEDVFRQLAGQVDRQLRASTEALGPITPGQDGWDELRGWVERYAAIYRRYEPVFSAFPAALESDEALAGGSARSGQRTSARLQARLATTPLPPRQLDPLIALLFTTSTRTLGIGRIMRSVVAEYRTERVEDALTDVMHRALFGVEPGVNVRATKHPALPPVPASESLRKILAQADAPATTPADDKPALGALLAAGHRVLVERGYHGARVDDIVQEAGVSRGAFYRYFDNRDHLTQVLAARAFRSLSTALGQIPRSPGRGVERATVRRWLRTYATVHLREAAMTRVWVDGALQDSSMRHNSATVLDWARRQMALLCTHADPEMDALVMVALLDAFGASSNADVDAAAHVICAAAGPG